MHHAYLKDSPVLILAWTVVTVAVSVILAWIVTVAFAATTAGLEGVIGAPVAGLVGGLVGVILIWLVAVIHGATGAGSANEELALRIYRDLK